MIWQDFVIGASQFTFAVLLLPSIRTPRAQKPAIETSAGTAVMLVVLAVTYLTLGMYLSAVACGLTAGCWAIMAVQAAGQ